MRKTMTGAGLALLLLGPTQAAAQAEPSAVMHQAFPQTIDDWARGARMFDGMGGFHRAADTASPEAQAYFDQGMRFLWAFNHDEATRSFARAAQIDPKCAMCFWGVALSLGPNYNMPLMAEARARVGWRAARQARALAADDPPLDRALIDAVAKRFDGEKALDPVTGAAPLTAYADAMREVAHRFPDDLDVQVMFAESLMNLNPWKLWTADGAPAPGTQEIVSTLEAVLAKAPDHPGANHYYIHAVEASKDPGRALPSARRIASAMPAAGHLVHMPSHVMQRVGMYEGAADANRRAAATDAAYYAKTTPIDYYPMYSAHNLLFLAASASMEGRRAETLASLREARRMMPDDMVAGMDGSDWLIAALYDAEIRFGQWDAVLAEPAPDPRLKAMIVSRRADRAYAFAAKGDVAAAQTELDEAQRLADAAPATQTAGLNPVRPLYRVALLRAKARIASARGDKAAAVALLKDAVAAEDSLSYDEPSDEFFPTRHLLGAALIDAGRPAEAEAVYREDLKRNPANGWSQLGLATALDQQGRRGEAADERRAFAHAWSRSDTAITRSAF